MTEVVLVFDFCGKVMTTESIMYQNIHIPDLPDLSDDRIFLADDESQSAVTQVQDDLNEDDDSDSDVSTISTISSSHISLTPYEKKYGNLNEMAGRMGECILTSNHVNFKLLMINSKISMLEFVYLSSANSLILNTVQMWSSMKGAMENQDVFTSILDFQSQGHANVGGMLKSFFNGVSTEGQFAVRYFELYEKCPSSIYNDTNNPKHEFTKITVHHL